MEQLLEEYSRAVAKRIITEKKITWIEEKIKENLDYSGELSSMDEETFVDDLYELILKKKKLSITIFQTEERIRKKIPD